MESCAVTTTHRVPECGVPSRRCSACVPRSPAEAFGRSANIYFRYGRNPPGDVLILTTGSTCDQAFLDEEYFNSFLTRTEYNRCVLTRDNPRCRYERPSKST